jgi:serine/threonine protein kinase/predicted ATPase
MSTTTVSEFKAHPRFIIARQLGAGGMGAVYEAFDNERNMRVALKTLPALEPVRLFQFKQEFRSLAEISHPNLVALYELISDGDRWFFTMELIDDPDEFFPSVPTTPARPPRSSPAMRAPPWQRFSDFAAPPEADISDGQSGLVTRRDTQSTATPRVGAGSADAEVRRQFYPMEADSTTANYQVDYDRVRRVFAQLARGVAALHRMGKLHRDLKPGNVIVRRSGQVVVLDFGLVANLENTFQAQVGGAGLAPTLARTSATEGTICGTLSYMSPEQAQGESLTPASDWYAVGVMLFQVLTGRLPFAGRQQDILYHKLESRPLSPLSLNPSVPHDLDRICNGLLERDPLARPSGQELLKELSHQGDAVSLTGEVLEPISELLPFVGRDKEIAWLMDHWKQVQSGNAQTVFVQSRSGTGKTTLIRRFLDDIVGGSDAVILTGRCYEQESVPYKALDSVVDSLAGYLLRRLPNELEQLIPVGIGALTLLFPVLNRVPVIAKIAQREPIENSDLRELRRLAFAALRELFGRLGRQYGLLVWIDDLQWGDADSACLLTELMRPPDAPVLLLLLSCRREYTGQSPFLNAFAESMAAAGTPTACETLVLEPLSATETTQLALALIGQDVPKIRAKAEWIAHESGGIPFFVYELVRHLKSGISQTLAEGANIDEVLWQRVSRLPTDTLRLLEVVAIAGRPLPLRTVQQAGGFSTLRPELVTLLKASHLVRTTGPTLEDEIETFHDRVRESVAAHLTAETRVAHHLALAENLESAGADPEMLAVHFEAAGVTGKACSYYSAAGEQAIRLLAFEHAEELFRKAAARADEPLNRARIHERMIHFFTDMARFDEAYAQAREALKPLGISLEAKFVPAWFILQFIGSKLRLRGRRPLDLLAMPTLSDPMTETAVRLINATAKAAYQIRPELCVAISTRAVNLCLSKGNTPDCAIGYMVYGTIFQGAILGNRQVGYEFGKLALALVDRYCNDRQRAEVNFVVGYFGTSWLRPAREAEALWRVAWKSGLASGDLFHTGCASAGTVMSQFIRGIPFDEVLRSADAFLEVLERFNLREPIGVITLVRQAIKSLRGETVSPTSLTDAGFDEPEFRKLIATYGSRHFAHFYFIIRIQMHYLWGDYEGAERLVGASAAFLRDSRGMVHSTEHHFYVALNAAARASNANWVNRSRLARQIKMVHARFRRWARICPENFMARERILAGELARLSGHSETAIAAFRGASTAAAKYSTPHLQALSEKLLSSLYRILGDESRAGRSLNSAVENYRKWGAKHYADRLAAQEVIASYPAAAKNSC